MPRGYDIPAREMSGPVDSLREWTSLIAGLPSPRGRYLVIVEAEISGSGPAAARLTSDLDTVAARLDMTRVPLVFMARLARIGVTVEAGSTEDALKAGIDAVAAAGGNSIDVKRAEVRTMPHRAAVLAAVSDLAGLACAATA